MNRWTGSTMFAGIIVSLGYRIFIPLYFKIDKTRKYIESMAH